jgi:hypothetical protein
VIMIQFVTAIQADADKSNHPIPTPQVFYDDYVQPEDLK